MKTPDPFRVLILALFLGGIVAMGSALARGFAADEPWIRVASLGTLRQKGVIYNEPSKTFIVRRGQGAIALSDEGPYDLKVEQLRYCRSSHSFEGYWNGYFDRLGRYYGGPALQDMTRVEVKIEEPFVYVDPSRTTEGRNWESSDQARMRGIEPAGPFCDSRTGHSPGFWDC